MKISTYPLAVLSIACLSGLVSCYPIQPSATSQQRAAAKAEAEAVASAKIKADAKVAAKKKAAAAAKKAANAANSVVSSDINTNTNDSSNTSVSQNTSVTTKTTVPAVVKFAAPVPGKDGFVFNPYTHNQVDVRGIPSGTKVRDPHDANPAHVFKVP